MSGSTSCGCCAGVDKIFSEKTAKRELRAYRKNGPRATTKMLIEGITEGANPVSVIDVGGGIGAVAHELVKRGAMTVHAVDASKGYLAANESEAVARGYRRHATYHLGDFVDVAPRLPTADAVTLDRVVCCYRDMPALLGQAAAKARHRIGMVLPRDNWWVRAITKTGNGILRLLRNPFRTYVHPMHEVDRVLTDGGFQKTIHERRLIWQVAVYERTPS